MTGIELGSLVFIGLIALLALRVHIGVAMLLAGSVGYVALSGLDPLLNYFKSAAYTRFSVYDLSVVPLFLLMGQFASQGGLSRDLFKAASALVGPGRLQHRRRIGRPGLRNREARQSEPRLRQQAYAPPCVV